MLIVVGGIATLSGYWTKSTNLTNNEVVMTIPSDLAATGGYWYGAVILNSGGSARFQVYGTDVFIRSVPSGSNVFTGSISWVVGH